jgi:hypothetical protein
MFAPHTLSKTKCLLVALHNNRQRITAVHFFSTCSAVIPRVWWYLLTKSKQYVAQCALTSALVRQSRDGRFFGIVRLRPRVERWRYSNQE